MVHDIPLDLINEGYAHLRIINPRAESNMLTSIRRFGQISPVTLFQVSSSRYEVIDGFKRLHVCQMIKLKTMKATLLSMGERPLKAAMLLLNQNIRSISDLEEGLVIASLHREDQLTQTSIATLLGHHKSWVCRRLALVERLNDDVLQNIRLGLINPSIGRELATLPRGNQSVVLKTILKQRLTTRQTVHLISSLKKNRNRPLIPTSMRKISLFPKFRNSAPGF